MIICLEVKQIHFYSVIAVQTKSMTITIHNHRSISNKWIRRIKYLLFKLNEKFSEITESHVYIHDASSPTEAYKIRVVLGLPGNDLVYESQENDLSRAIKRLYNRLKHLLAKWKDMKKA